MLTLGSLALASPWFLLAAIALPVVWQIIRLTPPAAKKIFFPAIKLLKYLRQEEETPRKAPLWLVLLRMALIATAIIAASHPILNPDETLGHDGPVMLVIDTNWAAAQNWANIQDRAMKMLAMAERQNQAAQIITTAPDPEQGFGFISPILSPAEAMQQVKSLKPMPWPARYDLMEKSLQERLYDPSSILPNPNIVWLSGGIGGEGFLSIIQKLNGLGQLYFYGADGRPAIWLKAKSAANSKIEIALSRSLPQNDRTPPSADITILAQSETGQTLGQATIRFGQGERHAKAEIELPLDIKNRVSVLRAASQSSAASTYLLDESGRHYPVGILASQALDNSKPLLDELYFIERAIQPFAEVYRGALQDILQNETAVMILSGKSAPTGDEKTQIREWVETGGVLIRFAGEQSFAKEDDLLPVIPYEKPRALQGSLAFSEPLRLGKMSENGPFFGLQLPDEVLIKKQLLAPPGQDLEQKIWASLSDGTPLVTGSSLGKGHVVLFHVTSETGWSNLPLSGLFVEMLQRLLWLSQGLQAGNTDDNLSASEVLDGFGQFRPPAGYVQALSRQELTTRRVSPTAPPGYYGSSGSKKAFNLSDHMPAVEEIGALPNYVRLISAADEVETDLRPYFYLLGLILALIDTSFSLYLRGLLPRLPRFSMKFSALFLGVALIGLPAQAQGIPKALSLTQMAYVKTYDSELDRVSAAGLLGLTQILRQRTAIQSADPVGVDLAEDELSFYPLLYWPVPDQPKPLSQRAAEKTIHYLRNGGMIVLDLRGGTMDDKLTELFSGIEMPLMRPMPQDHVLTRSFYLLKTWPGRYADKTVWVTESEASYFDGVSPVIIGTQDWAAAWAVGKNGKPMFATPPGGEAQREMALRFGVNLAMYALVGNYKADQVHVPTILERLGK